MRTTLFLLGALAAVPAAVAQTPAAQPAAAAMPDSYRDYQMRMLEHQRQFLLKMADSMPERLYRSKATPAQRDFAQQIHHAAAAVPMIVSMTMKMPRPTLPDTAAAFATRAGLRNMINASYDYAAGVLKNQTAEQRAAQVELFGNTMPAWQVWDELHSHTVWTAGQVVANFRENGMAPPAFTFF